MKFNAEAKQIFIDAYNDSKIPFNKLKGVINERMQQAGFLQQGVNFTAQEVRDAFNSLGMQYKNRPKKQKFTISFEDDAVTSDPEPETEVVEIKTEEEILPAQEDEDDFWIEEEPEEIEPVEYAAHTKEPEKFEF